MIYVFLKVVPKYYKHQSAVTLHKVFPRFDRNTLRLVEEKVIRGAVLAAERTTKNFLQILLSKLVILQFTSLTNPLTKDLPVVGGYIPLWGGQFNTRGSGFTSACENTYAGSESVSVFISSIGFWLLMPMCFHLLFHTFMCKTPPACERPPPRVLRPMPFNICFFVARLHRWTGAANDRQGLFEEIWRR